MGMDEVSNIMYMHHVDIGIETPNKLDMATMLSAIVTDNVVSVKMLCK